MKKRTINSYIRRKFIVFSVFVVVCLLFSKCIVDTVGNRILSNYMSNFFADKIIDENYETTDFGMLKDIKGWVTILDSDNRVIYSNNKNERSYYDTRALVNLLNGQEIIDGKGYFATS